MSDIFREVEEDVRREKLEKFWKAYGDYVIALAAVIVVGTAVHNVQPDKAGLYFDKIQCFCFTDQVLKPGQTIELPVQFFIDPEIAKDRNEISLIVLVCHWAILPDPESE